MTILPFPKKKRYSRRDLITPAEVYDITDAPPEKIVWAICPYTSRNADGEHGCCHCPKSEFDPDYGEMSPMCYLMAEEAYKTMKAAEKKFRNN